jgi:hypothetical protein
MGRQSQRWTCTGTNAARTQVKRILPPLVTAVAALILLQFEQAPAQNLATAEHPEKVRQFHISAGEAQITLDEFSRQSGLQLLYDFNTVKGVMTREVSGEMEPAAALRSMIDGTPLGFEFVNGGTVAIIPAHVPAPAGR